MKSRPILIVEDNQADQTLLKLAFKEANISNEIIFANDGLEALRMLKGGFTPFIIISDINMPQMNGIELKQEIDQDEALKIKAIPFIFMSSSASEHDVMEAFRRNAQGYFPKKDFENQTKVIKLITEYWTASESPNKM